MNRVKRVYRGGRWVSARRMAGLSAKLRGRGGQEMREAAGRARRIPEGIADSGGWRQVVADLHDIYIRALLTRNLRNLKPKDVPQALVEAKRAHLQLVRETAKQQRRASRPRPPVNRACKRCGERFTATRADAVFCKSACRQAAYRIRKG